MEEYNLITIYTSEGDPKELDIEMQMYLADLIIEIVDDYDIGNYIFEAFWKKADIAKATDEYIIDFIKNELKKGTF